MKGIKGLFDSRKAISTWLIFAGLTALLIYGYLPAETYAMMVTGIKAVWLGAHSHEESSKAKAGASLIDQLAKGAVEVAKKKAAAPVKEGDDGWVEATDAGENSDE